MSKFKKLTDFLKSLKCRLILLCILIGIVPSVLLRAGMLGSYENRAVSIRTSEILSQAKILANQIVSNDYLNNAESESAINVQLEQLSTIYDGRVMIIDEEFHIIKDTYNLDTGKTIISEEVIKSIQGEEISKYDSQNRYIEMTIPLVHVDPETENKRTIGVIMVSVSTDSINLNLEYLARNTLVMELIAIVAIIFAGTFIAIHLVAPFHAMAKSIEEIQTGYGDDALKINAYTETRQICEKFNKMLGRMKVLDDSRQEFVSNVSHELKTPLTSMKVLADSLLMQGDAPVELYKEFMQDIANEIDRESSVISDLLTLVKMDRKSTELNVASTDINDFIEQILKRLRPIAEKANIELVFESNRSVTAEIDATKLSLAFSNLVENAIKYNRENGWVRVSLDADHKFFYVKVSDSGIGIPQESIDYIFERFYRVDKSHSREIGGTGLGLAITRSAVVAHRGAIKVQSTVDEGTTFIVRIPLRYIV